MLLLRTLNWDEVKNISARGIPLGKKRREPEMIRPNGEFTNSASVSSAVRASSVVSYYYHSDLRSNIHALYQACLTRS